MITTEAFAPCSGSCVIEASYEDVQCDNVDTADDPSDDTFTAMISVDIVDGSGSWTIMEESTSGSSGDAVTVGPYLISEGDVTLTIVDADIPNCTTMISIPAPSPCSQCDESVDAGSDAELDCVNTMANLQGTSSSAGDPLWTGPGGFSVMAYETSTEVPGTYYFSVDFGQACVFIDSLVISVSNEIPASDAGPNQSLTCEIDTVYLQGSVSGGSGNFEYTWTDASGSVIGTSIELIITQAGNYFFVANDGPAAVISANPGDVLDCEIEIIYLTSDNEPNVVYSWVINNQPIVLDEISIDEPSEVMLMAIDTITGCQNVDILSITSLEEYPLIELVSIGELNCVDTQIILDGSNSQNGDNISYSWFDENNNLITTGAQNIEVTAEGIYYLELIDEDNGCTNRDTIVVDGDFDFPIVTDAADLQLGCDDISIDLNVMIEDENSSNFEISSCTNNQDGAIILEEPTNGTSPFTYLVDEVAYSDPIIGGLSEGSYLISIIDAEGCSFDTSVTVTVLENFEIDLAGEIQVIVGTTTTLAATVSIPDEEIASVLWLPSTGLSCDTCLITLLSGSPSTPDSYMIEVIDVNGCIVTAEVRVDLQEVVETTFPNVISSNGDGNGNDRFTVYTSRENATVQSMFIYDRWGELLFSDGGFVTNDPSYGWDGTFDGRAVVPGVFVYIVEVVLPDGSVEQYSGDLTVVR